MTSTEIEVQLENHKNRIETLETTVSGMQDLILSVKELTLSVKNLTETSNELKDEIKVIKNRDADTWQKLKFYVITCVVSLILGALFSKFIL